MATTIRTPVLIERGSHDYPSRDGRPMGESDVHRNVMFETIETLKAFFAGQQVYVTGNLLMFYEPGNRRKHLSPDAMVIKGAPPGLRLNYLVWEEGHSPQVVIEITSPSTKREDLRTKYELYRTVIRVPEYFLFDPKDEYLSPRLQGFRLVGDVYVPIAAVDGRLPSHELELHLEANESQLRFYNPRTGRWIPTLHEIRDEAEQAQQEAEQAHAENARLRRELDELKRRMGEQSR
jgi:Uma2 family endonuclease